MDEVQAFLENILRRDEVREVERYSIAHSGDLGSPPALQEEEPRLARTPHVRA